MPLILATKQKKIQQMLVDILFYLKQIHSQFSVALPSGYANINFLWEIHNYLDMSEPGAFNFLSDESNAHSSYKMYPFARNLLTALKSCIEMDTVAPETGIPVAIELHEQWSKVSDPVLRKELLKTISKVICKGRNRTEAIQRTLRSLDEFVLEGITTTIELHKKILKHKKFINSDFDTNWLSKEKFF